MWNESEQRKLWTEMMKISFDITTNEKCKVLRSFGNYYEQFYCIQIMMIMEIRIKRRQMESRGSRQTSIQFMQWSSQFMEEKDEGRFD